MEPVLFNPTVEKLQEMVAITKAITATDLTDEKQLAVVKEYRLKLRDARTTITKTGKGLRDDAIKYQKNVIAKEKELLAIIEPEEQRLKAIEEEAQNLEKIEKRKQVMPWRKEQLMLIADGLDNPTEEELLAMDDEQFNQHVQKRKADKLDAEEAEKREAEEAERREAEAQEREERARKEERERIEREQKEKEEREAKEKEEAEQKEKEEQEKAEKNKKYKTFLAKNGYTEETKDQYKIVREGDTFSLYKLVDTVTIK